MAAERPKRHCDAERRNEATRSVRIVPRTRFALMPIRIATMIAAPRPTTALASRNAAWHNQ
jgi:hypothetical protein